MKQLLQGVKGRFISGVSWNIVASFVSQGSVFLASIVAARLLGKHDFGTFVIIQSTMLTIAAIAGAGLGITASKYVSECRESNPRRVERILGLCRVVSVFTAMFYMLLIWFVAPIITESILHIPQYTSSLRIGSIYILFAALNGNQIGALVGFERFSLIAKINLFRGLATLVSVGILCAMYGVTGGIIGLCLTAIITWIATSIQLSRILNQMQITISYNRLWEERKVLTGFAFPASLSGIFGNLFIWVAHALLVQQTGGLSQMAVYSAAYYFRTMVTLPPDLIKQVASPMLSNLYGDNNRDDFRMIFKINLLISWGTAVLFAGFIYYFSSTVLLLYGSDFSGESIVLRLLVISAVIEVMAATYYQHLYVRGMIWSQFFICMVWGAVILSTFYFWTYDQGAIGLASGLMAGWMFSFIAYFIISLRINKVETAEGGNTNESD
jgi:O-antigen/teichoic acid export membrane protein